MENRWIDLHVHSSASDGTYSPENLVEYAIQKGLCAFALTDHDTIDGIDRAKKAAEGRPVEVIPGIEFSTEYHGTDIHIVGIDIAYQDSEFTAALSRFRDSRSTRNRKVIAKMKEKGIDISWEKMQERFGDAVWTRAHFGRYLMEHGYVKEIAEAFQKYIGPGCCCYVPREKVTPQQATELICRTGGIPILAHPMAYNLKESELYRLIQELKDTGLMGIEALYSTYGQEEEAYVRMLARRYDLEISGGSDFHGHNKPGLDLGTGYGKLKVPYEVLEKLRNRRAEHDR